MRRFRTSLIPLSVVVVIIGAIFAGVSKLTTGAPADAGLTPRVERLERERDKDEDRWDRLFQDVGKIKQHMGIAD